MRSGQLARIEERWRAQLASWALPEDLGGRPTASPWRLDPRLFLPDPAAPLSPSHEAALALIERGGERSLIDVGSGAGAAFWPIAAHLARVLAIDENDAMLAALLEEAARHPSLLVETRHGRLQELLGEVDPADVVVSHHVAYNVPELGAYLAGLVGLARVGVVIELTLRHPHYGAAAMFEALWGLPRPAGPSAADVVEAVWALGYKPTVVVHDRSARRVDPMARIEALGRRLLLGPEEMERVSALLADPGELVNPAVSIQVVTEGYGLR
jgi:2-polyprenyl-3-methyl-5-hydroxy-6-metoxy-1,4-benzoquinol methylase